MAGGSICREVPAHDAVVAAGQSVGAGRLGRNVPSDLPGAADHGQRGVIRQAELVPAVAWLA